MQAILAHQPAWRDPFGQASGRNSLPTQEFKKDIYIDRKSKYRDFLVTLQKNPGKLFYRIMRNSSFRQSNLKWRNKFGFRKTKHETQIKSFVCQHRRRYSALQ
ncbi:hypothetical protein P3T23_008218 [Paraburkholderia sp. GAS448]|jgi:hypothetical protein|uniref:hypothetical protein n=1 Tax=Paraburkholderia sp. GAS448 TaxID=3035136 RepID=UPI003D19F97D